MDRAGKKFDYKACEFAGLTSAYGPGATLLVLCPHLTMPPLALTHLAVVEAVKMSEPAELE